MTRWLPAVLGAVLVWMYVRFVHQALSDGSPRGHGRFRAFGNTLAAWTALPLLGALGARLAWDAGLVGAIAGIALLAAVAVLLVPWPLATAVAIPHGWPKTTYGLARLSTLHSQPDPVGLAMAASSRALLRRPEPDAAMAGWIESHGQGRPITPGMVLAHGLLAAHRGDDRMARRLLHAVEHFDPAVRDDVVITWAREWRAAEAAERGAWPEVIDAAARLGPGAPVLRWLDGVGRRYINTSDAPTDESLDARWRQIPVRRKLSDLHHACIGHHHTDPERPAEASSSPLQCHIDALAHPTPTTLADAVDAWGSAAESEPYRLPRALADLSRAASEVGLPLPPLPTSLKPYVDNAGADEAVLGPLELASQRLHRQLMSPVLIDPLAGLFDWMELDGLLDEVRRGGSPSALRLAFRPTYGPLTTLAVALYNDLDQPLLSNALTRWLLALAQEVGDHRAVEHQTQNLSASLRP